MTPTLRDLLSLSRRALARADALLVAAPVCVLAATGCSPTPPTNTITDVELQTGASTGGGEMVEVHTTSGGSTTPPEKQKECKAEPMTMSGCGGGRAKLVGSLTDCQLKADEDLPAERCKEFCGSFPTRSCTAGERDGEAFVFCHASHPCLGRMPSRRLRASRRADVDVAAYLRHASRMEAVSVDAFVELGETLSRFGAPKAFAASCARSAADEARHAASMDGLLRTRGARVRTSRARRTPRGFATLEALAIHNEREGVVGETWGAILAAFQSARATDPTVKRTFATIAREEMRHAALSARISAWSAKKLDAPGRARLAAERRRAVERIARTSTGFPGRDGANELGWPSEQERAQLVAELAVFFG